ncbi:response regulator transcription factor [Culicoidibacter larvae]|uniref:Response regulator transcription factor n=1 Tax=Culicoidibacter larvae TaxID=2579976 RepID=A0A5R8QAY3_9FIRM|nr:response regulator transcription factor [Culicoidibacter larvae]TLG72761.1 response regulator transcription factor [Culicoidibacter larvae]
MKRILFVDDDPQYQEVIRDLLVLEGYAVDCADNAADGLRLFREGVYDLVISDLMMVSIDGHQFLSLLRKYDEDVKVVILTGSDDEEDELKSFDLHATEYLKKSTSINIILKRLESAMRQSSEKKVEHLYSDYEDLEVDIKKRLVVKEGEEQHLTGKEFALLLFFLKNKNVVLTREEILKTIWRMSDAFGDLRTVDTYVKKLRAKLELSSIVSIRGIGYEWVE